MHTVTVDIYVFYDQTNSAKMALCFPCVIMLGSTNFMEVHSL